MAQSKGGKIDICKHIISVVWLRARNFIIFIYYRYISTYSNQSPIVTALRARLRDWALVRATFKLNIQIEFFLFSVCS